jgi:BASS family bile acid:Na+ symporter
VLIPTAVGIAIRHRFPELARRLLKPVRIAAAVLLVVAVIAGIAGGRATLWNNFGVPSAAVVSFCAVSLTVVYLVPRSRSLRDFRAAYCSDVRLRRASPGSCVP